ncbi:hypothetical protein EJ04DRAFT_166217 [Polyplosphaeria fusca]|uniref:Uncharacterized protein n=1 Tax=Polyplosphaeria fusca TaxID=682080 RepID=A0A9P4R895_9PLEO|nr:hypothetical protein EJ04DRAFT_166217 [Polyplosphaeria fusca]
MESNFPRVPITVAFSARCMLRLFGIPLFETRCAHRVRQASQGVEHMFLYAAIIARRGGNNTVTVAGMVTGRVDDDLSSAANCKQWGDFVDGSGSDVAVEEVVRQSKKKLVRRSSRLIFCHGFLICCEYCSYRLALAHSDQTMIFRRWLMFY